MAAVVFVPDASLERTFQKLTVLYFESPGIGNPGSGLLGRRD